MVAEESVSAAGSADEDLARSVKMIVFEQVEADRLQECEALVDRAERQREKGLHR